MFAAMADAKRASAIVRVVGAARDATLSMASKHDDARRAVRREIDVPRRGVRLYERHREEREHREMQRHREARAQEPREERHGHERHEVGALGSPRDPPQEPLESLAEQREPLEAGDVGRVEDERLGGEDPGEARRERQVVVPDVPRLRHVVERGRERQREDDRRHGEQRAIDRDTARPRRLRITVHLVRGYGHGGCASTAVHPDRARLDVLTILKIGNDGARATQKSVLAMILRLAKEAGTTPWTLYAKCDRYWARIFDGSGIGIFKIGPKDARFEVTSCALASSTYWRIGSVGSSPR